MFGLCHFASLAAFGNFGVWGGIGLILNLAFGAVLVVGLTLLVLWTIRSGRVYAATVPYATGQPTAKEILQARYARGEITREQYERIKQDIG